MIFFSQCFKNNNLTSFRLRVRSYFMHSRIRILLISHIGLALPDTEISLFGNLKLYIPHYYDIRYLVRYTENFIGSLNKLGQELYIRIGIQHQARSDSIITM